MMAQGSTLREWYLERIGLDQGRAPPNLPLDRHHCRFPGRDPGRLHPTMNMLAQVSNDCVFAFKYSSTAEYAGVDYDRLDS